MPQTSLTCKFCQSPEVVKHGKKGTAQRYLCNSCNHHFVNNGIKFPRMRSNEHIIVTSLNLYFEGLSARKVQKQMNDIYGEELSQTTIWSWVQKYSKLAAEYAKTHRLSNSFSNLMPCQNRSGTNGLSMERF